MTVSSTTTKNSYSGDGSTHEFTYGFKITAASELKVIIRTDSTGVEAEESTSNYVITGIDNDSGGTVLFKYDTGNPADAHYSTTDYRPQTGETVLLKRDLPLTQTTDYTPNDPFPAEAHEDALDRLTFIAQQINERVDRSIVFPESDPATTTIPNSVDRANKYLAFGPNGDVSVTAGTSSDIVASAYAQTLLDDTDAATARNTLGLGSLAVQNTIDTTDIDDDAVTNAKLADDSVENAQIADNAVTLGTQTTGNYVATITTSGGLTVSGSGSETAAVIVSHADTSSASSSSNSNNTFIQSLTVDTYGHVTAISTGVVPNGLSIVSPPNYYAQYDIGAYAFLYSTSSRDAGTSYTFPGYAKYDGVTYSNQVLTGTFRAMSGFSGPGSGLFVRIA
jgi:hypothetical protein